MELGRIHQKYRRVDRLQRNGSARNRRLAIEGLQVFFAWCQHQWIEVLWRNGRNVTFVVWLQRKATFIQKYLAWDGCSGLLYERRCGSLGKNVLPDLRNLIQRLLRRSSVTKNRNSFQFAIRKVRQKSQLRKKTLSDGDNLRLALQYGLEWIWTIRAWMLGFHRPRSNRASGSVQI